LKDGNKNDRVDARKLAELLYLNNFNSVYHGEHGRVMARIKAIYRLGNPLCRPTGVCAWSSGGMAGETQRSVI
jgi:hypothetical protein